MDPNHAFPNHRLLSKRQGGGILGGLVPNDSTSSTAKPGAATPTGSQNTGNPFVPSGIVGAFSTLLGDIPSVVPSSGPSSVTTSSTSLTPSSSSSTGSTTSPTSSTHTTTSTSSTTSSTSTTPTTHTPTPTSTPSVSDTVYASSEGTTVVYLTSTLPAASATAAPPTSFLQNPSLEGGVFTLVGIVVLIIVFVVVTWTLRTRRRNRLERDLATAVTFDPGPAEHHHYEHQANSIEKRRLSGSSSGHGHSHGHGYGYGHGVQPAYAPPQEYHGPMGYGQYPAAAYHTPSVNPAPYRAPSPTVSQPGGQGGANLTRKFSDRKPVPPLLPNPAYDPSNSHVSIPAQFYQQ